jgi:hypothetical protein
MSTSLAVSSKDFKPSSYQDRFISQRATHFDLSNTYEAKSEIFSQQWQQNQIDKMGNHSILLEENNENLSQQQLHQQYDENQRMYTTLLQNQVLGIQNPHLIEGGYLNDEFMDSYGSIEKSIPLSLAPPQSYNVLKYTPQKKQTTPF